MPLLKKAAYDVCSFKVAGLLVFGLSLSFLPCSAQNPPGFGVTLGSYIDSFAGVAPGPIGVAATPTQLLISLNGCTTVTSISQSKVTSIFTKLPDPGPLPSGICESYLAISPGQGGFPTGNVCVTQANRIYVSPSAGTGNAAAALFATLPLVSANNSHTGISFDSVGTFGYKMIVSLFDNTSGNTTIYAVDSGGQFTTIASLTGEFENPQVLPLTSQFPGSLLIPFVSGGVYQIAPVTHAITFAFNSPDLESISYLSPTQCTFAGSSYFQTLYAANQVVGYTPSQLASANLVGKLLTPQESTNYLYYYPDGKSFQVPVPFYSGHVQNQEEGTVVSCPAGGGCPATQGYWKHHAFPANLFGSTGTLTIGTTSYSAAQLVTILNTPPQGGNAVLILGHQLIAALANVAGGAQLPSSVAVAIHQAELLFATNNLSLASVVASSTGLGQQLTALGNTLDNYNSATGLNCQEAGGLAR